VGHARRFPPILGLVLAAHLLAPETASAQASAETSAGADRSARGPIRLGAALGASFPHGVGKWDPAFAWGFFVDLPLVSHFYVTPSAVLYQLDPREGDGFSAADVSMSFKFGFPIDAFELYGALTTGLTSADEVDVHFGGLAGMSFQILDNLDVFVQVNYRVILADVGNVQDLEAFVGPAFRF
jgi:hypothetical protein